ncbi:MAG: imidazoleglycerol-phosphate dehydratase HisB [Anaerovoracaceae bacterium]|jgi:imidazoleglycerol-phosphate dehydratase
MTIYEKSRKTGETDVYVSLDLYGEGKGQIDTGIGFFDHMLAALTVHGGFDLTIKCRGDLEVDSHHTIEDVGITLGKAFKDAVGDRSGIARYGFFLLPMDESLALCSLDISGRPFLVFKGEFSWPKIGEMESQMIEEFFRAFAMNAEITLHIDLMYGSNDHHRAEAIFKAFAHSLKSALTPLENKRVLSTKGVL